MTKAEFLEAVKNHMVNLKKPVILTKRPRSTDRQHPQPYRVDLRKKVDLKK